MAILVKLVAVDAVFAAARAEDLSSRQLKQAAYSLIINTRAGSARQGGPRQPLTNCLNFVSAEKLIFKIYKLVEEVSLHIIIKFDEKYLAEPKLWPVKQNVQSLTKLSLRL